jgi:hypothetical protein
MVKCCSGSSSSRRSSDEIIRLGFPSHKSEAQGLGLVVGGRGQRRPAYLPAHGCNWMMRSGVDVFEAAGYLGMSVETLPEVYGHHHPSFQEKAARATGRR